MEASWRVAEMWLQSQTSVVEMWLRTQTSVEQQDVAAVTVGQMVGREPAGEESLGVDLERQAVVVHEDRVLVELPE